MTLSKAEKISVGKGIGYLIKDFNVSCQRRRRSPLHTFVMHSIGTPGHANSITRRSWLCQLQVHTDVSYDHARPILSSPFPRSMRNIQGDCRT